MQVTLCDWRTEKGEPCGERADMLITFTQEGKRYEIDICSQLHGKMLTANAREAATSIPAGYSSVTKLPKSTGRKVQEQLVEKADYVDLRKWLESQGDLPEGSRGRISATLQSKWLEAGSPREVADGSFKKSA